MSARPWAVYKSDYGASVIHVPIIDKMFDQNFLV